MSDKPNPSLFYVDVEIFCPKKGKAVKLCIETQDKLSKIVKGKPYACAKQAVCSKGCLSIDRDRARALCLLNIEHIEVSQY